MSNIKAKILTRREVMRAIKIFLAEHDWNHVVVDASASTGVTMESAQEHVNKAIALARRTLEAREVRDADEELSIQWNNRHLVNESADVRVAWNVGQMTNNDGGNTSVHWQARFLHDAPAEIAAEVDE